MNKKKKNIYIYISVKDKELLCTEGKNNVLMGPVYQFMLVINDVF